jgi:tricarballylate dehydrogenase
MPVRDSVQVLVVGGGSAALCAAIAARRHGASVRLVEWAPKSLRGGNTRHARNFRLAHAQPTRFVPGCYSESGFLDDILRVTRGATDGTLARLLVQRSAGIEDWLIDNGVHLERRTCRSLPPSSRTAFLLGGGKAMINALYATATSLGITVCYDSRLTALDLRDDQLCRATIIRDGEVEHIAAKATVICAGGNQADVSWLRQALGEAADGLVVRGTPYASGSALRLLLDCGMRPVGDPARCHMVAVDARGPEFDGGIVTRMTAIPHGIVVDRNGVRFADEGEDIGKTHFAKWGARISNCPGHIAYLIMDAHGHRQSAPSLFAPIAADDVGSLAAKLDLDPVALDDTIRRFNSAIARPRGTAPARGATAGLEPPKSRHAVALATPPFAAYPLRPGLTFSYFGIAVDAETRVLRDDGTPATRLFAAGTIMAANVLGDGYLAGLGITISIVFGQLAGQAAARQALH